MNLDKFIGMEKRQAQNFAEANNLIFRLISVDGKPFYDYPPVEDARVDRVCVELEGGKVSKVTIQ